MNPQILSGKVSRSKKPLELCHIHTSHDAVQIVLRRNGTNVTIRCGGDGTYKNDLQEFILFSVFYAARLNLSKLDVTSIITVIDKGRVSAEASSEIHLVFNGKRLEAVASGPNTLRATALAALEIVNGI